MIDLIKNQQYNNRAIQVNENSNNFYQKNTKEYKKNLNVKDLINEFKGKRNESKNLLNSLNIDKPIDNFGRVENIEKSDLRENYFEQNKNVQIGA